MKESGSLTSSRERERQATPLDTFTTETGSWVSDTGGANFAGLMGACLRGSGLRTRCTGGASRPGLTALWTKERG
jgi:hypothetical protein